MDILDPNTESNVKNQHYVWKRYLAPWLTNKKLWCMRESKIFNQKPEKLAKEEYFYRISQLTGPEFKVIACFLKKMANPNSMILNELTSLYVTASMGNEFDRNNVLEKYHANIERNAGPVLDSLYLGDISFWNDSTTRANFGAFIGLQYLRTKKQRDALLSVTSQISSHPGMPEGFDFSKLTHYFAIIMAESIGYWIHSECDLILIECESGSEFLTSDQPAYNLKAVGRAPFQEAKELEIYYPISPEKALVLSPKSAKFIRKTDDEYNSFMVKQAREYVFARSESVLRKFTNKISP